MIGNGGKASTSLKSLINEAFEDINNVFIDEDGHLAINAVHHDGTNHFFIKMLTEKGRRFYEREKAYGEPKKWQSKLFSDSTLSVDIDFDTDR